MIGIIIIYNIIVKLLENLLPLMSKASRMFAVVEHNITYIDTLCF